MNSTNSTPNLGGLAPEDRQCRYVFAHGRHCRSWAIRGHQYCHRHGRWQEARVDGPIEIPLMEDPSAVEFVASQTIRALSWGHIPPENGRAILYGCRMMQIAQAHKLAEAKFRLKCQQLGLDPNQFLDPSADAPPAAPALNPHEGEETETAVLLSEARIAEPQDLHSQDLHSNVDNLFGEEAAPAPRTQPPVPLSHPLDDIPPAPRPKSACDACAAALAQGADESLLACKTCPASIAGNLRAPQFPDPRNPPESPHEPAPIPPSGQPAFRDLRTRWEATLVRLARKRAELRYPRHKEDREDFRAARRERPFADYLHHYATSPPPPIPKPASLPHRESAQADAPE